MAELTSEMLNELVREAMLALNRQKFTQIATVLVEQRKRLDKWRARGVMIYDASQDETTAGLVRGWLSKPWCQFRWGVLADRLEELGLGREIWMWTGPVARYRWWGRRQQTRNLRMLRRAVLPLFGLKEILRGKPVDTAARLDSDLG